MSNVSKSYIDKLLDGATVEWKALGNLLVRTKGTKITAGEMKELHKENAQLKIFAGGKTFALVDFDDIPSKDINYNPSVIVKSRGVIEFEYYDKPFSHKNEMWSYHSRDLGVNIKYVYYFLKTQELYFQTLGSKMQMPQIATPDTDKFQIPIPPLHVQAEIVRILDTFTELTTELTTELATRKKQYSYYRDKLLTFDDSVEWKNIPEVADTFIGLVTTMTKYYVSSGVPLIHNSSIKENRFVFNKQTFLDYEFAEKNNSRSHIQGDIITVHTGDVGTSAVINEELVGSLGFATIVSRIKNKSVLSPYFLCHFLNSEHSKKQIYRMIKGDRDNLNLKDFNKIKIPIPPLAEQERIVAILDKFDTLTNSISEGLPREIESRKQQYEYYRDMLLTFPKNDE